MDSALLPPSADQIARLADDAMGRIPAPLRQHLDGVAVRVEEFPDEDTCREMELDSPFDLMGLYVGTPLTEKSGGVTPEHVDVILLYRRPMLDYWCESGEDFGHLVRHVLIHEVGHHFGFSDDDMAALEAMVGEAAAGADQL